MSSVYSNAVKEIKHLYKERFNGDCEAIVMSGGGSSREYFRLTPDSSTDGNESVIGVYCEDIKENIDFLKLQECLKNQGINVPEVYAVSSDFRCYLLQDLGDVRLFDLLNERDKIALAQKALRQLIKFQLIPEKIWKDSVGYKPFSERLVKWDLNYFKYDFLKPAHLTFDEDLLEDDFASLITLLLQPCNVDGLMYRDFQSRNIMVKDDNFYLIDFQGARKGPVVYDAVSFIWQAKAPFTFEEREILGQYYISQLYSELKDRDEVRLESLHRQMSLMQVFRCLQVLGAYGFRGLIEGKAHFKESISPAINNLKYLTSKGRLDLFPELKRIAQSLEESKFKIEKVTDGAMTVRVYSFSYKKGYPEDPTGNGGGFMFDCRAIHNPGRYEEYRQKTGRDREVISFLENTEEAGEFIDNSFSLVKPSIERYLKRGFTSLLIGFGCTGGQHRSVYCAEKMTRKIKENFPEVNVILEHREQQIKEEL